ncbi:disease resistance protein At4g27190-like isoform X3 [Malania oleifera]|uniref:disease resistance protein At4g27190-like isoform X3 n=1 Tax=Malania oleifera TaxID=397392 RepID=UPI0025AE99F8|nr:disease resistance protein At4g27190-like isoform X3 [Malania oleifera]
MLTADAEIHEEEEEEEEKSKQEEINPLLVHAFNIHDDGYGWRCYGKSENLRGKGCSHYRCSFLPKCRAKKRLVHLLNGRTLIIYQGEHDHSNGSSTDATQDNSLDDGEVSDVEKAETKPQHDVDDAFDGESAELKQQENEGGTTHGAGNAEMRIKRGGTLALYNFLRNHPNNPQPKCKRKLEKRPKSSTSQNFRVITSIDADLEGMHGSSGHSMSERKVTVREAGLRIEQSGEELMPPNDDKWERTVEVHLVNSELSTLTENPRCPKLSKLVLQGNYKLRTIPSAFFQHMPALQLLNLSKTSIKSLPLSLFGLVSLKELYLNDCESFMVLSPKVGELKHLEVLDLEGTEIIDLPGEIRNLTKLKCLKVSFYGYMNCGKKSEQSRTMIPRWVISSLWKLEELCIDVNPDDERWHIIVENVMEEICCLQRLGFLKFYFPKVELLGMLQWKFTSKFLVSRNLLVQFRVIVGHHVKRIISRLLHDVEFELKRWRRCLTYVCGEGIPGEEIRKVLGHATAFHLDRHVTAKQLSEFGIENMKRMKCCILGECNEIQAIIDGEDIPKGTRIGLESLEYLNIYYMKNLRTIWAGPVQTRCFLHLKSLNLRTCPQLATIFTRGLLLVFSNLQELIVEDCPAIKSLVSWENPTEQKFQCLKSDYLLPKLKKISLHFTPELTNLSGGLRIAPELEWMSIYDCPKLKSFSHGELSSKKLKTIKGERHWWDALEWEICRPECLAAIFIPIESPLDIIENKAT